MRLLLLYTSWVEIILVWEYLFLFPEILTDADTLLGHKGNWKQNWARYMQLLGWSIPMQAQ